MELEYDSRHRDERSDNASGTAEGDVWPRSTTNLETVSAVAGIAGPLLFAATDAIPAVLDGAYDPIAQSVSFLTLRPLGWIQTVGFYIFGALLVVLCLGFFRSIPSRRVARVGVFLLSLIGLGFLFIGLFPTNPGDGTKTLHGDIHLSIVRMLALLFPAACLCIAVGLRTHSRWRPLFEYTALTGLVTLVMVFGRGGLLPEGRWFGLYERILLGISMMWIEVVSLWLLWTGRSSIRALSRSRPGPATESEAELEPPEVGP